MKDTTINLRCTECYKDAMKRSADELGMTVSQYFRFAQICRLNLEMNEPDFYKQLLEMSRYMDF